jgi:hypothetical protein
MDVTLYRIYYSIIQYYIMFSSWSSEAHVLLCYISKWPSEAHCYLQYRTCLPRISYIRSMSNNHRWTRQEDLLELRHELEEVARSGRKHWYAMVQ